MKIARAVIYHNLRTTFIEWKPFSAFNDNFHVINGLHLLGSLRLSSQKVCIKLTVI